MKNYLIYLLLINLFGFILALSDKNRAIKKKQRIRERTLLGFAILGGGVGLLLAMLIANHKTRKKKFIIGVPLITVIHLVVAALILN
ncbi:MAG: DUF1294 domain-containing protein [Oscillospiraceae bacterium]|nr:DUF1294 domain-containing protein [Oscillospiraceae bacterium]